MSAILYDARGNEIRVGFPDGVTNETTTDTRPITAVLGALNAEVVMDLNGATTASYDVRTAAGALTVVWEGTVDGVNYFTLVAFAYNQLLAGVQSQEVFVPSVVIATTLTGLFIIDVTGLRRIRIRVSAYTSGNVTVAARATAAEFIVMARPLPSTLLVTATAAVNTGATATLPAPGVGLFHYITRIELVKLYAVVGVANGAGVIITSTNLPGGPSWTTEQIVAPIGSVVRVIDQWFGSSPLKSSVANTSTTFVAGGQLQTIWRWNVTYWIGA